MRKKGVIAIVAIGAFGVVSLLLLMQQALERGLQLEPLVELKQVVERSYDVDQVRVYREVETGGKNDEGGTKKKYWIVTEYRPGSNAEDDEVIARAVLERMEQGYKGDRDPVMGFRVNCLKPDVEKDTVKLMAEKPLGPTPVRVIRSPGSE